MDHKTHMQTETATDLSAADRLEIFQLMAAYNSHEDAGNAEAWAALFTSDGCFMPMGRDPDVGRDALVDFARRRRIERPEVRKRIHWGGDAVLRRTADGAKAQSSQMTVDKIADGHRINNVSGKEDELRRENGKWRFHVRRVAHANRE